MEIFYTKLYKDNDDLSLFYEAAQRCGFMEIPLYCNPDMSISDGKLSIQMDGSLGGLCHNGKVIVQFPTGMGIRYDSILLRGIKLFPGTKIVLSISDEDRFDSLILENEVMATELINMANAYICSESITSKLASHDVDVSRCVNPIIYERNKYNIKLSVIKSYIDALVAVSD